MGISTEELLQKAVFDTTAFGGAGEAPLAIEQVTTFIELMTAGQDMLPLVSTKTSNAPKWQESILDFAARIAKPGVQGVRLTTGDRSIPVTGLVEMNTVLLRAEIPVADEVWEDNVAGQALRGSLETLIADRMGFDVEELMVNGDLSSGDAYLALLDGWVVQATNDGNVVSASADGQDYMSIFRKLKLALPNRFKRRIEVDGAYFVPTVVETLYRDLLSNRETASLGDLSLTTANILQWQGIPVVGVANLAVTAGTPDTSNFILGHKQNFYAGYQRRITAETFRDPREGAMSFVLTARVDAKIAVPSAVAIATSCNVEP
jgi:hypothetical protein